MADLPETMKAIVVHAVGGPEAMSYEDAPVPTPAAGEVLVQNGAIGVNMIDTYHRNGLYALDLPTILGREGAGTVVAVGDDVSDYKVGDRVAYAIAPGSYAEYTAVDTGKAVLLPDAVSFEQGAGAMLQGMTAHYLVESTFPVKEGHRVLIQAAAGGMGLILCQLCHNKGATVFGTASSAAKLELAAAAGADHTINYIESDFHEEVTALTDGAGVHVVYDGVGKVTFDKSLDCLAQRGMMVSFGNASGPVDPFSILGLSTRGSLFLTRPSLFHYVSTPEEFAQRATDVVNWVANGELDIRIGQTFPLAEAQAAHEALEGRKTTGKVVLIP